MLRAMAQVDEAALAAARAGDHVAFQAVAEPYRRELQLYSYRMLGSLHDAEDRVQDTMLRAWRALPSFEGGHGFRAWLYRIATNACLDALAQQRVRSLPWAQGGPGDPADPLPAATQEGWIDPLPDSMLAEPERGPEARYQTRESVALAFVAALQWLPGRQRAVLILRDVLGFSAEEVAAQLQTTVAAANSSLQRARATLQSRAGDLHQLAPPTAETSALLSRYMRAWEDGSLPDLVSLLTEDAVLSMPPIPLWLRGAEDIAAFYAQGPMAGDARGRYRALAIGASGQPACAMYVPSEKPGVYAAFSINVLTLRAGRVQALDVFLLPDLFKRFGLPLELSGAGAS